MKQLILKALNHTAVLNKLFLDKDNKNKDEIKEALKHKGSIKVMEAKESQETINEDM
jgi:hypothetical protein